MDVVLAYNLTEVVLIQWHSLLIKLLFLCLADHLNETANKAFPLLKRLVGFILHVFLENGYFLQFHIQIFLTDFLASKGGALKSFCLFCHLVHFL